MLSSELQAELTLIMDAARAEFRSEVSAAVTPIQRCIGELDARLGKLEADQLGPRIVVLEGEVQRISTLATCILEEVTSRKFAEHTALLKHARSAETVLQELACEDDSKAQASRLAEAEAPPPPAPETPPPSAAAPASPRPGAAAGAAATAAAAAAAAAAARVAGAFAETGTASPSCPAPPAAPPASPTVEGSSPAGRMERKRSQSTLSPLPEERPECLDGPRLSLSSGGDHQDDADRAEAALDQTQATLDQTQATLDPDGYDCTLQASISSMASDTTAAPDSIAPCQLRREPVDASASASRTVQSASEASLHVADCPPAASAPAAPPAASPTPAAVLAGSGASAASAVGTRSVSPLSHRWAKTASSPQAYSHPASTPSAPSAPQVASARQADFPVSSRSLTQSRTSPARDRRSQLAASAQTTARSSPPPAAGAQVPAGTSQAQSSPQVPSPQPIVHIATSRGESVSHWTAVGTSASTAAKHNERERFLSEITALREENKSLREVKQQQLMGGKVETAKRQTSCPLASIAPPQPVQQIRGLVQAATPQAVWAPCGGGMPWTAQAPLRQATTPMRQASSPVRQRNL